MDHKALLSIALVGALTLAQEQPANCPAGCEPTACPYPDRKSILNHITSDPQNSDGSSLPKLCNICEAVYGSGNPDISGIGAMISYGIQGLTATLFGSLVMALRATFLRSSSNTNRPSLHRSFRQASRVAQHTIQTNNTLTWSIMIATAVRMRQDVPIAEQWFLARLVRYQMLLSFMTCAASIAILERHVSSSVHIVITYALLRCIRSAATLLEERREGLGSVGKYCAASREGVADDSDGFASSAFAIGFWSTLSVIVFSGFRHIGPLRAYLGGPSDGYVIALFVAYTLCSGGTLIVLLWDMQLHRRDLRSMAGVAYEDDEWGFGQVMAVLLWVPLLQTLVKGLPGFFERQFDRVFDWVWWWIHPDNRT